MDIGPKPLVVMEGIAVIMVEHPETLDIPLKLGMRLYLVIDHPVIVLPAITHLKHPHALVVSQFEFLLRPLKSLITATAMRNTPA